MHGNGNIRAGIAQRAAIWVGILLALPFALHGGWAAERYMPTRHYSAAEIQLELQKMLVLGSVLYIAAHPDDENTAVLSTLSSGRLMRTAYLSMTRGDGGQNLIGAEKGALIGVMRTEELLSARRIDRGEQYFTRANDFGFSKQPDETLEFWGREDALADMVWVIRSFQPDVIITRFPSTGEGRHGHHTASAILAEEAFHAAADPARFAQQLAYVQPWQATRLLWNTWLPEDIEQAQQGTAGFLSMDVGAYNALLGKSYMEIAAESRSRHKCQGFGTSGYRGSKMEYFRHTAGKSAQSDLFEGIEHSWNRVEGSATVVRALTQALAEFEPAAPHATVPLLLQAWQAMQSLPQRAIVEYKKRRLLALIQACTGMWLEALASDYSAAPGTGLKLSTRVVNRSPLPFTLEGVSYSMGAAAETPQTVLKENEPFVLETQIRIPENAPYSQPYWLRETQEREGLYTVAEQQERGKPWNAPALAVQCTLSLQGTRFVLEQPAMYHWTDPVEGERYRPFEICPPVTVTPQQGVYVFRSGAVQTITLSVKAHRDSIAATLALDLPAGWSVGAPEQHKVQIARRGTTQEFQFAVRPPLTGNIGTLRAVVELDGREYAQALQHIDYEHIPAHSLYPPAEARLIRRDIHTKGETIGYIMGSGDEVPAALEQLGYTVKLLGDRELESRSLEHYDAIVCGVRAFNTREQLAGAMGNLLRYVYDGGTLLVQYNVNRDLHVAQPGPYPITISWDRITDETATMEFLNPQHPVLQAPNPISPADFEGWVQERGLYFAREWDERYETVLAGHDAGEPLTQGSLLYTRYGKGVFIYTGLAFFRQLPAGVSGAYALFANLVSARGYN